MLKFAPSSRLIRFKQIQIEFRRHALRIVVSIENRFRIFVQIETDKKQIAFVHHVSQIFEKL